MTTSVIIILVSVLFLVIILSTSRTFYLMDLKTFTKNRTKKLGLDVLDLAYSFDQMVYVVSLPSSNKELRNAREEDIIIDCEYTTYFFPRLLGIKVSMNLAQGKQMIAYLPIKDFRLPKLDQLQEQGILNESDYLKISTYKLIHESTLNEISEEVYRQLVNEGNNSKVD